MQLVIGESQLEEYLLEYDPNDKNQSKAKSLLRLASDYLRQASQSSDSVSFGLLSCMMDNIFLKLIKQFHVITGCINLC